MNTTMLFRIRTVMIVAACMVVCGCSEELPSGYFPLQQGLEWKYWVVSETPYERNESELQITNAGIWEVGNQQYHIRKTNTGNYYYIQDRQDGIVRSSKRTIIEAYPRLGVAERYVIKYPLQVGTQWSYKSKPYLLARHAPTVNELKEIVNYQMDWEIVSDDVKLSVPAGEFENCLHIQGKALVEVPRSLGVATDEVLFETNEWYAPNVGLVKIVHEEKSYSEQAYGGSISLVLMSFNY